MLIINIQRTVQQLNAILKWKLIYEVVYQMNDVVDLILLLTETITRYIDVWEYYMAREKDIESPKTTYIFHRPSAVE